MKKVKIDINKVIHAFRTCAMEREYFLDTKNGDIVHVSDFWHEDEKEKAYKKIDAEPERYIMFPPDGPRKVYYDMLDFAATIEDRELREKLYVAVEGRGGFRRFTDILLSHPSEKNNWQTYIKERTRERINDWLEENGIEIAE